MLAKNKTNELNEAERKINDLHYEIESSKRKVGSLETRVSEYNVLSEKVYQYESKISSMTIQIEKYVREQGNFENLMRENDDLKRKVMELGQMHSRINEYEYKIEMVTKEIERLNVIVEKKNREINILEGKAR